MQGLYVRVTSALLRAFFSLLYNSFAWSYDWVAAVVSLGRWQQWVLSVVDELHGPRVLELGHGPGHLQLALRQAGVQAFGLDLSRRMGCLAGLRLHRSGFVPLLVNGYAQKLPFASGRFHQIVATFPADFILEDPSLREIARTLAPGGSLILLPVAWITGKQPLEQAAAWLFRVCKQAPDPDDPTLAEGFCAALARAGLHARAQRRTIGASTLLVIHAQKPPARAGRGARSAADLPSRSVSD